MPPQITGATISRQQGTAASTSQIATVGDCNQAANTLVVTVKKGVNDGELGRIVEYALQQPSIRGVTFQPVQTAGRYDGFRPATDRLTLRPPGVRP